LDEIFHKFSQVDGSKLFHLGRRLTAAMAANKYPTLSRHFEDKL